MSNVWDEFQKDNDRICSWFNEIHKIFLKKEFEEIKYEFDIELTGSRANQLAYPESDIDFAFICETDQQLQFLYDKFKSKHEHKSLYSEYKIKFTKTLAGLLLIVVEDYIDKSYEIGPIKLDISFRTFEKHKIIQTHVIEASKKKFLSKDHRLEYILEMRSLKLSKDEEKYNKNKEWLRVLPKN